MQKDFFRSTPTRHTSHDRSGVIDRYRRLLPLQAVGSTLPLELFGREGYGRRLGWCTSAKQLTSAIAPVAMAVSMGGLGVVHSLWTTAAVGTVGAAAFLAIVIVTAAQRGPAATESAA